MPASTHFKQLPSCGRHVQALLVCLALVLALPSHAGTDLTTLSIEQLMGLTVVGASKYPQTQGEVPAAASIITRDDIRAFGWRTLDQVLASLPGVHGTYDRQYSYLGMRGFGLPGDYNSRILVTINGNRVNDPVYDQGPVDQTFPLDLNLVERIEFIPGPGGAVYGQNAMFGVVNVITRYGAEVDGVDIFAAWKSPQRSAELGLTVGHRLENDVDALLSVTGLRGRGQDLLLEFGSSGYPGLARGLDGEASARIFARLARGPWAFDLTLGNRGKDDPTGSYLSDPLIPGQYSADRYMLASFQFQDHSSDQTLQFSTRLFVSQYRFSSRASYGTTFDMPASGDWQGGEMRLLSTSVPGHKLMIGMDLQNNARIEQQMIDIANPSRSLLIARSGYRAGIFAQDEWRVTDGVVTTFGLRVDRSELTNATISPRLAFIWQPTRDTTLKALYGQAQRAPNAFERDYSDGISQMANPALRGEKIETMEWVLDHRAGSDLSLRSSFYQWGLSDLITLGVDPISGIAQYQSGAIIDARGVELSADKTWPGGSRLRGSASFQKVRTAQGNRLVNSPERLFKLALSAPLPVAGLRAGYEWQYDGQRLTLEGRKLGGYAISHLHLSTDKWLKAIELSLAIRNLFDKRYAQPGADTNWQDSLEQDGRSFRLQGSFHF